METTPKLQQIANAPIAQRSGITELDSPRRPQPILDWADGRLN